MISTFGPGGPGGPCEKEGDVYEADVALPRTGSDEPVNIVVSTSGPGGPGGPCDEEGGVCEGDAALPRPVPMRQSIVLLAQSAREAPVMRPGRWRTLPEM